MDEMEQMLASAEERAEQAQVNEIATQPGIDEAEGAVPPGYDWPTNGGPLGCLMGLIVSCVSGAIIGPLLYTLVFQEAGRLSSEYVLINLGVFVLLAIALGRLGWWAGKRFYRYYPQAKATWGEEDVATEQGASVADEPDALLS